jgi:hypothetical protein
MGEDQERIGRGLRSVYLVDLCGEREDREDREDYFL